MSEVATHIAEALDLDLLVEVLARKLQLEAREPETKPDTEADDDRKGQG